MSSKGSGTCLFCRSAAEPDDQHLPVHFNGRTFYWYKCLSCELVFLFPQLSEFDYAKLYPLDYHEQYYFHNHEADHSLKIATALKFGKGSFLDYGCGDGGFVKELSKNGYNVTGAELGTELLDTLQKEHGHINFLSTKELLANRNLRFQFIHLGDVLEHIADPVALIDNLKQHLLPGGIFIIDGPLEANPCVAYYFRRITIAVKRIFNENWGAVTEPYHVFYSNRKNQQLLFEKRGLRLISFKVYEKGWPYPETLKEVKSVKLFLEYCLAKFSIMISGVVPGWGNRFMYVGRIVSEPA